MADSVITEEEFATGLFAGIKMQAYGHEKSSPINIHDPQYSAAFQAALTKFREICQKYHADCGDVHVDFPDASIDGIAANAPALVHDVGCTVQPSGLIEFHFDQGGADKLLNRKPQRTAFCFAGQAFVHRYFPRY